MELHSITPTNSLDKLKCTLCDNFLSHFPIKVSANNRNICGRCPTPEDTLSVQNLAFETLSQFLKFPCRYQTEGCDEEYQPKNIPTHEKECQFRIIPCPTKKTTDCDWQGSRPETLKHCRDTHSNLFLQNCEFVMDSAVCDEKNYLLEHEDLLFIFSLKFDGRKLEFEMYTHEFEITVRKYSCQLGAKCGKKSLTVDFNSSSFKDKSLNELVLESIISQSDEQNILFKIKIGEVIIDPDKIVNLELLSVLKCFICLEYAVPPIYHCVENSNPLCSDCRQTHQDDCASCKQNTSSTRNFNLDKIAHMLNYPCKNHPNGCSYVSKPDKIKSHQVECKLGNFDCPIKDFEACAWKGPSRDLEEHIQNNHQELVTNSSQLSKQLLPQKMKCDVIKFANRLFRLVCLKTIDEKYFWSVQVIGPFSDEFKYEIEIVDPENKGRRLLVRQKCGVVSKKEKLFVDGDSFCYFLNDQIEDFVNEQVITFKVRIFV